MTARRTLKAIGATFLALLIIAAGTTVALSVYAAIDKVDAFHIEGAQLADRDYLTELEAYLPTAETGRPERFGFSAHRIVRGPGTILGYRFYSNGKLSVIDDESYRKITIWLPSLVTGNIDLSEASGAVAIYSAGGSAWPDTDCSGFLRGSVTIERAGFGYDIGVHATLEPLGSTDILDSCGNRAVDVKFRTKRMRIDDLTAWLGNVAAHPYHETYR